MRPTPGHGLSPLFRAPGAALVTRAEGWLVADSGSFGKACPHCGSNGTRRLGECNVCHRSVCEHCGSVQFSGGVRSVYHKECLKKSDGQFKMIKFVQ